MGTVIPGKMDAVAGEEIRSARDGMGGRECQGQKGDGI
jgi:hypothetical protein